MASVLCVMNCSINVIFAIEMLKLIFEFADDLLFFIERTSWNSFPLEKNYMSRNLTQIYRTYRYSSQQNY